MCLVSSSFLEHIFFWRSISIRHFFPHNRHGFVSGVSEERIDKVTLKVGRSLGCKEYNLMLWQLYLVGIWMFSCLKRVA